MKKRIIFYRIATLLLAGLLCYALINALLIYLPQKRESDSFAELKQSVSAPTQSPRQTEQETQPQAAPVQKPGEQTAPQPTEYRYAPLKEKNADFAGWLSIADTLIDYPVMKPPESQPEYYLHRNFDGEDSSLGCLFIGKDCGADSTVFVIYGHNMNNDSMFGTLDSYADYEFASQHREILFETPDGARRYRVFAAFQTKIYAEREDVFRYYEAVGDPDAEEYAYTVESLRSLADMLLSDAPQYPAQLLLLSTCSYHTEDGRFVVAAYRTE